MDANFHLQVGMNDTMRASHAEGRPTGHPVRLDRPASATVVRPTARQIADAIVRFMVTGARG